MKYILLIDTDVGRLINTVNKKMSQGWVAQGGINIRTISRYENELIQAMVKTDKKGDL